MDYYPTDFPPAYTDLDFSNQNYNINNNDVTSLLPPLHRGTAQTQHMQQRNTHSSYSDMAPGQHVLQQPWNMQFNHAEHPRPHFPPPYTDLEFSNPGYISDNNDVITTSHPQQHDTAPSQHVQQQSWSMQNQPDIAALEHVQEQSWNMQIDQSDLAPLHVAQQQPCNMERPQILSNVVIVNQPDPAHTSVASSAAVRIPELMMCSIFTCLFCNLCLGVYAISRSYQAKQALELDDYNKVMKHSRAAKCGIYTGLVLGIMLYTLLSIAVIVAISVK